MGIPPGHMEKSIGHIGVPSGYMDISGHTIVYYIK